ncbi:ABC transporter substrate-binding protein [Breoghania sp. JC706]|uniref:ABC transporter substrate-binding protein n=1 Tax=Breoghania sp. JC706 TaxID=3117732 RepID=UPI003008D79D
MNRKFLATLLLSVAAMTGQAFAHDLKIALQSDADVLDPDQSRTFVGRIVYTSLCDKLVDITPGLKIIPQLATEWSWSDEGKTLTMKLREGVTFHDGEPFNAEAVAYNINRSKTLPESRRKSELTSVESTEVVGDYEIKFHLKQPDATLMAQLADRAGMMIAPQAAEKEGADFGANPVCSGPFKFKERVAQDRIVLTKYDNYWNADKFHFDNVTFLPIPDTTVRLANLRSGDIDMLERLAATDLASAKADPNLKVEAATSLGYQGITINTGNGENAKTPIGEDKRLRQALSLSFDRDALNQVVFEGAFQPGNQPVSPSSPWYDESHPVPARDVEKAKALLKEAGFDRLEIEMAVPNNPVQTQVVQVLQAMAAEANIDIKIVSKEFAKLLSDDSSGAFMTSQIGWSGRVDPDGNIHGFVTCKAGLNDSGYCNPEVDKLLNAARSASDDETRKKDYDAANAILLDELPIIYLYHEKWIWAMNKKLEGFTAYPDGMIRLENVTYAD